MKTETKSTETNIAIREFSANCLKDYVDSMAESKQINQEQYKLMAELLKMTTTGEVNEVFAKEQGWQFETMKTSYKPIVYFTHVADLSVREVYSAFRRIDSAIYEKFINLLESLIQTEDTPQDYTPMSIETLMKILQFNNRGDLELFLGQMDDLGTIRFRRTLKDLPLAPISYSSISKKYLKTIRDLRRDYHIPPCVDGE